MAESNKKDDEKEIEETAEVSDNNESSENDSDSEETAEKEEEPEKSLEEQLEDAITESKDAHDRVLRISAEFENFKKRSLREIEEFRKFANESLIRELLSVVDNMERAITSAEDGKQANNGVVEGVELTLKEILKIFERFSVTPIQATGSPFDPAYHQAVSQEETDEYPENTVIREFQNGYMIHDRLLRPAMVVVSKAKTIEDSKEDVES